MRRLAAITTMILFIIVALIVLFTLPAAAQGAAGASTARSLLPPWIGRTVLAWVISAATLAALYYFVVLPLANQAETEQKIDWGEGLPAGPKASAFAPLRWKNQQNEAVDYLVVGSNDGVLSLMNRKTGQIAFEVEVEDLHSCPISCMAVCQRTGRIAVPAGLGNDVLVFRMSDIIKLKPDKSPPSAAVRRDELGLITALAFSASGATLAVGVHSGPIALYRADQPTDGLPPAPQQFSGHSDSVQCLAFDPTNDAIFASGGKDRSLWLWGRQPGGERLTHNLHQDQPFKSLAFSPDGKILAAAVNGEVELRDLTADAAEPYETLKHPLVNTVAWCRVRLVSLSETEGTLWEPEAVPASMAQPGEAALRNVKLTRKLLKHGGVYITSTRSDTALLTVGRDNFKRVDNVVWELPLHAATMQPLPLEPEFELPQAPIVLSGPEEPIPEMAVVEEIPHKRVRRRKTARGPVPTRHKLALASTLIVALIPAYLVKGTGSEEPPPAESATDTGASRISGNSIDQVDFPTLQTLVKNATDRMRQAIAAPKNKTHDQWVKVRSAAELIDNEAWFKKAQQENDALKQGKRTSRQALDDIAQSRLILARAHSALGDDAKAVQVVVDLLNRFPQADVPAPGGNQQPIEDALRNQLKNVYTEATKRRKG